MSVSRDDSVTPEQVPPEYRIEEDYAPQALAGVLCMVLGVIEGLAIGWWVWG